MTTADLVSSGSVSPVPHRVISVRRETRDTFTVDLRPPGGVPVAAFAPGQFNMLYAFGVGESAISISGDPGRRGFVTHTVREVGAVTTWLGRVGVGADVGVRGPFGRGWPVAEAAGHDVVLIAGGIGFAPLRSLIYELLAHRDLYGRIGLLYGARTPGDVLFRGELEEWSKSGWIDVQVSVDRATESWRGHVGVVTTLLRNLVFQPTETVAFVCGPEIMMRFAAAELLRREVAPAAIHVALERNMQCGVGLCGHCQIGPAFVCRDGPVFSYDVVEPWLAVEEL